MTAGSIITVEIFGVNTKEVVKSSLVGADGRVISETTLSVDLQGDFITNYQVPSVPSSGIYIFRIISQNSTAEMKMYIY